MEKENLNISFKKATLEDVDEFLEIERSIKKDKTYIGILDKDEAKKELADYEVYLIYKNRQLVGNMEFQIKSSDHAYLAGLTIRPNFQGQGIGRKAALFCLEKLKGVKKIDLVTHPENFRIINLYKSLDFKIEKRIENYFGDGEPRLMLVKED